MEIELSSNSPIHRQLWYGLESPLSNCVDENHRQLRIGTAETDIELCRWESTVINQSRMILIRIHSRTITEDVGNPICVTNVELDRVVAHSRVSYWMLGTDWGIQFPDGNGSWDPNPHSSTTMIWIGESTIELCWWELEWMERSKPRVGLSQRPKPRNPIRLINPE